jgi:hypothetical protein
MPVLRLIWTALVQLLGLTVVLEELRGEPNERHAFSSALIAREQGR